MIKTTDDISLKEVAESIATADKFDREMIPEIPIIMYYDSEGNKLFSDNRQEVFYAFNLWVVAHNLKGYYCEVETEWWDDNDEYQGPVGKRNYQKFYFNDNEDGSISDMPSNIFRFNLECVIAIKKHKENK